MCSTTTVALLLACAGITLTCNPDILHTTPSPLQTTTPAAIPNSGSNGNNAEQEAMMKMLQTIVDQQKEMETKMAALEKELKCEIPGEIKINGECKCPEHSKLNADKTKCVCIKNDQEFPKGCTA